MPTPTRIIQPRQDAPPCCGGITVPHRAFGSRPCNNVDLSMVTNGDFDSAPIVMPATLEENKWGTLTSSTLGGTLVWSPSQINVTSNNAFSFQYLFYYVKTPIGLLTKFIDRTKRTSFSFNMSAVNVRGGKKIILTFQSVDSVGADSHYYQTEISAEPYGTYNLTIMPADWVAGITPAGFGTIGTGTWGSELVTFFITTGGGGTGRDDDYIIDNVELSNIVCI